MTRDIEEIKEILKCDADAEAKCRMISEVVNGKPHYFKEPKTDYKSFCEWVASEIIDEEMWDLNWNAFPELACRKLNKLGVVDTDGKSWIYDNEALEQKVNTDIKDKIISRMWNCKGKKTLTIDKVKMENIVREEFAKMKREE